MLKGSPLAILLMSVISAPYVLMPCVCDPSPMETEEQFRAVVAWAYKSSVAVFSGELLEKDALTLKFKVKKSWKGVQGEDIVMSTGVKKVSENIYASGNCNYGFEIGKIYLVFAQKTDLGLNADKCSLTQTLDKATRIAAELDRILTFKK